MGKQVLRWSIWPMSGFFVWACTVQLNDLDPWVWIGMYGGAAVLSLLAFFGVGHRGVTYAIAAGLFGWGCYLSYYVIGQQHLFDSEEGREMLGLWIVAAWLVGMAWVLKPTKSKVAR